MALVNSICVNGRDVLCVGYFVDLNYLHSFYILFFFFQQSSKVVNLNQYDCNLCSKSFSSRSLLTRHLKNHSTAGAAVGGGTANSPPSTGSSPPVTGSEAALVLRCEQSGCNGRSFASQISLVKHIKSSHELVSCSSPTASSASDGSCSGSLESQHVKRLNEKRFQCGQCSKRFPTSKDLKRHEVVHTGNRDFQCSFCSHRFGRKDHRMRHEKKTHANEYQLSSSPISPSALASVSNTTVSDSRQHQQQQQQQQRPRWRHVSSPSVSTASPSSSTGGQDIEMTDLPVRIRAMSTSSSILQQQPPPPQPPRRTTTDAPLYDETSLKYLESQLSPESLLMEDTSEDDSASAAVSWIMSEFMIKKEPVEEQSPASPPETPDPSSLSPPVLYPPELAAPVKLSQCDVLTRTKNPVLPSVYIDNSLIVPEPSKHKYHHSQNLSPSLLGSGEDLDDVDLDYFEAFMDDKETVNLFPVWTMIDPPQKLLENERLLSYFINHTRKTTHTWTHTQVHEKNTQEKKRSMMLYFSTIWDVRAA